MQSVRACVEFASADTFFGQLLRQSSFDIVLDCLCVGLLGRSSLFSRTPVHRRSSTSRSIVSQACTRTQLRHAQESIRTGALAIMTMHVLHVRVVVRACVIDVNRRVAPHPAFATTAQVCSDPDTCAHVYLQAVRCAQLQGSAARRSHVRCSCTLHVLENGSSDVAGTLFSTATY